MTIGNSKMPAGVNYHWKSFMAYVNKSGGTGDSALSPVPGGRGLRTPPMRKQDDPRHQPPNKVGINGD